MAELRQALAAVAAMAVGVGVVLAGATSAGAGDEIGNATVRVAKQKDGPFEPDRVQVNVSGPKDLYFRVTALGKKQKSVLNDQSGGTEGDD